MFNSTIPEDSWYALQIRTRFAQPTAQALIDKGYETFLPTYKRRTQWSDRVKECELPLFPGYLFCRFNPYGRLLPILTTPGVLAIVCAGKTPVRVPTEEIQAIRNVVRSGLPAAPWPQVTSGTRVVIEKGPLAGVEGVALMEAKACRLIVSVELLRRAVTVEINREWARPLSYEAVACGPLSEFQARQARPD